MKKSIILSLVLLFGACATPHIEHTQDNKLQITFKDKVIAQGKGELLHENKIRLSNLTIEQKVLLIDKNLVVSYEDAIAGSSYKFNHGMQRTVAIIFSDYSYELIATKANIYFFKLSSQDSSEYLILENINKKRIKMIYGINKEVLEDIYNSLDANENLLNAVKPNKYVKTKDNSQYIKSNWNPKNIILDTIVTKIGSGRIKR